MDSRVFDSKAAQLTRQREILIERLTDQAEHPTASRERAAKFRELRQVEIEIDSWFGGGHSQELGRLG